jgi:CHAT domain
MAYVNFDLRVEREGPTATRVSVLFSAAGEPTASGPPPPDLHALAGRLRALTGARGDEVRGFALDAGLPPGLPVSAVDGGRALFEALMPGAVLAAYRVSLDRARSNGTTLRVRLRLADADLAAVPWEFAFDPALGDHVCLSNEISLVRYLEVERAPAALVVQPPLRVLGLAASPSDLPALDVKRERADVERAVEHLVDRGGLEIHWLEDATWQALQAAMRQGPWHVFHFIGHGGVEDASGEGVVVLCDDDRRAFRLSSPDLGRLLSGHPTMRLALLNCCEGARPGSADVFSSVGAELIRRGIPAVVAMQFPITDRAALQFSRTFYDALLAGVPLDRAVGDARRAIRIALGETCEWATPVLHLHALDGVVFEVDVRGAVFRMPAPAPAARGLAAPQPLVSHPPAPSGDLRRGLDLLAQMVQRYWIDGVLEPSVFRAALIALDMDRVAGAVVSPWVDVFTESGRASQLPPGQAVTQVFEDEGGALLILGEPGAGKTTAMLGLLRDLLERLAHDHTRPVPVVFNLSSWRATTPLDVWLTDELSAKYRIPKAIGRTLIDGSHLLPMLDGLDEVAADDRDGCVGAINAFIGSGVRSGAVVCCRSREYVGLSTRLALNTAIQLRELSPTQIFQWVDAVGAPLAGLAALLRREPDLLLDARSPLMLSLMAQAYRDVAPETLAREPQATARERRGRVMEAYIARMFRRAAGSDRG